MRSGLPRAPIPAKRSITRYFSTMTCGNSTGGDTSWRLGQCRSAERLPGCPDGGDAPLQDWSAAAVLGPANVHLTVTQRVDVRANTHTVFTADFTPPQCGGAGGRMMDHGAAAHALPFDRPQSRSGEFLRERVIVGVDRSRPPPAGHRGTLRRVRLLGAGLGQ